MVVIVPIAVRVPTVVVFVPPFAFVCVAIFAGFAKFVAGVLTRRARTGGRNRVACLRSPKKDLVQRITNVPPESRATHSPLVKWVLKALR